MLAGDFRYYNFCVAYLFLLFYIGLVGFLFMNWDRDQIKSTCIIKKIVEPLCDQSL